MSTSGLCPTIIGGPLAFPAAYYTDSPFFPSSRSHFERAAGLSDGGYPAAPDGGPAPLWGPVAAFGAASALVLRTRLRVLLRGLRWGRKEMTRSAGGRCCLHTSGHLLHGRGGL
jgi:hypothetical protein